MIKSVAVQSLLLAISGLMAFSELPASATVLDSPQQGATAQASPEQVLIAQDRDDDDDNDNDDRSEMESSDRDDDNDDDNDDDDSESVELDRSVQTAIVERVAAQSNVSVSQLRVVAARRETWTDGCLGLGTAEQICTQAITPGYVVVLLNGDQPLVYRTNAAGTIVALDRQATASVTVRRQTTQQTTQQTSQQQTSQQQTSQTQTGAVVSGSSQQAAVTTSQTRFSQTVRTAVFQAIAQRTQVDVSQLRIVEVRRRAWATSCLGLSLGDRTCTQAITPGYLVVASRGDQVFVYRTDATGSVVLFDQRATEIRTAQLRARTTAISFRDVSSNYWAASFIRELAALDIIDGYPDGNYRPDQPVTRAEFAAIIRRAFNEAEVRQAINFLDVDRRYWAYSAIQETYQMGFLSGVNNLFRPVNSLSKGDVLFALATGLRLSATSSTGSLLSVYGQTNLNVEQRTLLAALTEQGIVVNYPDLRSISLDRTVTRAEVAVIVYQTLSSLGYVQAIDSPYVVDSGDVVTIDNDRDDDSDDDDDDDDQEGRSVDRDDDDNDDGGDDDDDGRTQRQNCNQGIGNGAEGCDPGNSSPRGGSNDEGGRTPGNRP